MAISSVANPTCTIPTTSNSSVTGTFTTHAVGNLLLLYMLTTVTGTISSITGGGVDATGWQRAAGPFNPTTGNHMEIWWATVGSVVTSSTVTLTFSASQSGAFLELDIHEWSSGLGTGTKWAIDATGTKDNTTSSTTLTYPTLVPGSGHTCLYWGHGDSQTVSNAVAAGSTSGYTYFTDAGPDQLVWNPGITASTSPTGALSPADTSAAIAVLMSASVPGPTRLFLPF